MRVPIVLLFICAATPAPAHACSWDSPTARLPGYSDEQADKRADDLKSDWDTISHHNRVKALLDQAPIIYLARISKVKRDDAKFQTLVSVEPLRRIKGTLPSTPRTLKGFMPDSCDRANGDGDGAYTTQGDLIIVFEGVAKRTNRPNGIDSVRVADVRNLELLDEVQIWLNAQPGYKPYD